MRCASARSLLAITRTTSFNAISLYASIRTRFAPFVVSFCACFTRLTFVKVNTCPSRVCIDVCVCVTALCIGRCFMVLN